MKARCFLQHLEQSARWRLCVSLVEEVQTRSTRQTKDFMEDKIPTIKKTKQHIIIPVQPLHFTRRLGYSTETWTDPKGKCIALSFDYKPLICPQELILWAFLHRRSWVTCSWKHWCSQPLTGFPRLVSSISCCGSLSAVSVPQNLQFQLKSYPPRQWGRTRFYSFKPPNWLGTRSHCYILYRVFWISSLNFSCSYIKSSPVKLFGHIVDGSAMIHQCH